jgi:flagella basal body P-ring formation protein FlgA
MMRSALVLLCALLALPAATAGAAGDGVADRDAAVRDAVVEAVRARFRQQADLEISVDALRTDVIATEGLVAVPDPGARTGQPAQFTLRAGTKRAGIAVATVIVAARHVRAIGALDRNTTIVAALVEEIAGEVAGVRFETLPRLDEVIGTQPRRAVAPGEVLSHALVMVPDAVRAGDEVKVVARVGALEAWGVGRASGSGRVGDVVRITRGSATGLQRARVLSPGIVQVLLEQPQEIR